MIKLFIGAKGSGKTKTLIELVNSATVDSKGSVVCIEKGDKLRFDITSKARLIDTDFYNVDNAEKLFGFIAGILASNNDITDIFVDSSLKICKNEVEAFQAILPELDKICTNVNLVMTVSIAAETCPEDIKKFA